MPSQEEKTHEVTFAEAVREALREEMLRDERVFLIGEDIGVYGGAFSVTRGLLHEFGEDRVRDTPISEAAIVGAAIGSAVTGMRPVAEIMFMDFITISMDQLVNQAAKIRYMFGGKASVPMVLRTPAGSGTGAAEQHSQSLEALVTSIPGLKAVIREARAGYINRFTGSVVWPHDPQPGIILVAGEKTISHVPKMDMILVCEAREFRSTNEAAGIFNDLWNRFQPFY